MSNPLSAWLPTAWMRKRSDHYERRCVNMMISKPAIAGTLESSDCMVTVMPGRTAGISLEIESVVLKQYGDAIRQVAEETIRSLGVEQAFVKIQDRGALDCVIAARVETAILRTQTGKDGAV